MIRFFDQADYRKRLSPDLHNASHRLCIRKEQIGCPFVQESDFMKRFVILIQEASSLVGDISDRRQIVGIDPEQASAG